MTTDLVGRALGDALAEALGWPPSEKAPFLWIVNDAGDVLFGDDILTWAGVGLIVEALKTREYAVEISAGPTWTRVQVQSEREDGGCHTLAWIEIDGDVPTAVAQAALAALGGEQ